MIYDFRNEEFSSSPMLDWRRVGDNYETRVIKNGIIYLAYLEKRENSYKMKLVRESDRMIALEIRLRSLNLEEIMPRAEFYIFDGI